MRFLLSILLTEVSVFPHVNAHHSYFESNELNGVSGSSTKASSPIDEGVLQMLQVEDNEVLL